jgi:hypothetical protein
MRQTGWLAEGRLDEKKIEENTCILAALCSTAVGRIQREKENWILSSEWQNLGEHIRGSLVE